ncbi:MAG: BACON domain-containing carbohydrate-binding protein [Planctomycetota bacterium]
MSNADWITVTSGGSGTGNGLVDYSVSANTGTSLRTATMIIAGQTFTVAQDGIVLCKAKSITVAPKKLPLGKNGNGDVAVTVNGAGRCPVEGATVTATISGSGNQIIDVSPVTSMVRPCLPLMQKI